MTLPPIVPIVQIYRGDTFEQSFVFQSNGAVRDLVTEGWGSWVAQIRATPDAATHVDFTIDSSQANVGRITLKLTHTQTSSLEEGVFDLQASRGSERTTFIQGSIVVVPDVSHV